MSNIGSLASLLKFDRAGAARSKRVLVTGQSFSVERIVVSPRETEEFQSLDETMLLVPGDNAVSVAGSTKESVEAAHAVVILPPGRSSVRAGVECEVYVLATDRQDIGEASNAANYQTRDARIPPLRRCYERVGAPESIQYYPIKDVPFPEGNARLKFFQSTTMSINWVEYVGGRDRTQLNPHAHGDFEQGSLSIVGCFTHHLRQPWGPNALLWREDEHLEAGPSEFLIIPPEIIHTTEGVGPGRHILIDVFAPPRDDFRARNWVHNANLYRRQEGGGA